MSSNTIIKDFNIFKYASLGLLSGLIFLKVEAQERSLIIDTLKLTGGNQTKAAKVLGTTKRIIQYKITKLGINPKLFRKNN